MFNRFSFFFSFFFFLFIFFSFEQNKVNVVENTRNITLHSKYLNISTEEITINQLNQNGTSDKTIAIDSTEFNTKYDLFTIHAKQPLTKGAQYELFIPFRGELGVGLYGYYRSSYTDQKTKTKR